MGRRLSVCIHSTHMFRRSRLCRRIELCLLPVEEFLETGNCLFGAVFIWFKMNHLLSLYIAHSPCVIIPCMDLIRISPTPMYCTYNNVLYSNI
jgi:hypothetical protein